MNEEQEGNLSDADKACIDLNKEFLVAQANTCSTQSKELIRAAVAYSQQAIRGMFLLHGACATAIVATKEIATFKCMLVLLAFGALFTVLAAGAAYIAQRFYAVHYGTLATKNLLTYHAEIQGIASPDFIHLKAVENLKSYKLTLGHVFSGVGVAFWCFSAFLFFIAILTFIGSVKL